MPGLRHRGDTEIEAYSLFYEPVIERVIVPTKPEAVQAAREKIQEWRENDVYWGLYTGCFDAIHPNHFWAIIRARIEVAKSYCQSEGVNFDELPREEQVALVISDRIALLVSVDGDLHLAERKTLKTSIGSSIRPVQNWGNRAIMVSTVMLPAERKGTHRPAADLIVGHDKFAFAGTIFQDQWELGKDLLPNCWIIFAEDHKNMAGIRALNINTDIRLLPEGTIIDTFTNQPYSTSVIVERIISSVGKSPK